MKCPVCGGKQLGKLRKNFFFCWNCYMEIKLEGSKTELYTIEEDGNLHSFNKAKVSGLGPKIQINLVQ